MLHQTISHCRYRVTGDHEDVLRDPRGGRAPASLTYDKHDFAHDDGNHILNIGRLFSIHTSYLFLNCSVSVTGGCSGRGGAVDGGSIT